MYHSDLKIKPFDYHLNSSYLRAVHIHDAFGKWLQGCEKYILMHSIIIKEALNPPNADWFTFVKQILMNELHHSVKECIFIIHENVTGRKHYIFKW